MDPCPICYENLDDRDYCITACKHKFCIRCITTFIESKDKCPYCNSLIAVSSHKKKSLHKTKVYGPVGIFKDRWLIISSIVPKQLSYIEQINKIVMYCYKTLTWGLGKLAKWFNNMLWALACINAGYSIFNLLARIQIYKLIYGFVCFVLGLLGYLVYMRYQTNKQNNICVNKIYDGIFYADNTGIIHRNLH